MKRHKTILQTWALISALGSSFAMCSSLSAGEVVYFEDFSDSMDESSVRLIGNSRDTESEFLFPMIDDASENRGFRVRMKRLTPDADLWIGVGPTSNGSRDLGALIQLTDFEYSVDLVDWNKDSPEKRQYFEFTLVGRMQREQSQNRYYLGFFPNAHWEDQGFTNRGTFGLYKRQQVPLSQEELLELSQKALLRMLELSEEELLELSEEELLELSQEELLRLLELSQEELIQEKWLKLRQEELTSMDLPIVQDNRYKLVFSALGDLLTGKVFDLADLSKPMATVSARDQTYASGGVGFLAAVSNEQLGLEDGILDFTVDNLKATIPDVNPQLEIQKAFHLSWPRTNTDYVVESATSVEGPWAVVEGATTQFVNDEVHMSVTESDRDQFFRLKESL